MSGSHGGKRLFSGRKASSRQCPSQQVYLCPVCHVKKRSDKLNDHINKLCCFDEHGKALQTESAAFKTLSEEAKRHTKFCSESNISKKDTEKWKTLRPDLGPSSSKFDTSVFKKWKKDTESVEIEMKEKDEDDSVATSCEPDQSEEVKDTDQTLESSSDLPSPTGMSYNLSYSIYHSDHSIN